MTTVMIPVAKEKVLKLMNCKYCLSAPGDKHITCGYCPEGNDLICGDCWQVKVSECGNCFKYICDDCAKTGLLEDGVYWIGCGCCGEWVGVKIAVEYGDMDYPIVIE